MSSSQFSVGNFKGSGVNSADISRSDFLGQNKGPAQETMKETVFHQTNDLQKKEEVSPIGQAKQPPSTSTKDSKNQGSSSTNGSGDCCDSWCCCCCSDDSGGGGGGCDCDCDCDGC